jgi:hypothetical protein
MTTPKPVPRRRKIVAKAKATAKATGRATGKGIVTAATWVAEKLGYWGGV